MGPEMVLYRNNPQIGDALEVDMIKSIEYIKKEERIIESLLEMLDHSARRMEQDKDVPPYMLKEIIELLQIYIDMSHTLREEFLLSLPGNPDVEALKPECEDIHASLRKYERFLLKVVEAYDLGYQGARRVFSHYAQQYIYVLRQHLRLESDLLRRWIVDHGQPDSQLLKELKKIDGGVKKTRERGLVRMETLKRDMRTVAA
jgi:hemerythrin-like domain-containing protein